MKTKLKDIDDRLGSKGFFGSDQCRTKTKISPNDQKKSQGIPVTTLF